ncbi:MAG: hypothetical protein LBD08_01320 [Treponema sp.]|jgi:uncharacterized phage infection (PIP) family protein YhgE|nr:hypothetical protein [Treponema sp.]
MVTLEQIKLLESKIIKAINLVNRLAEENIQLKQRNNELEELAGRLRDEKMRVEAGIVSALERLNQFEDAIERSLSVSAKPARAETALPGAPQAARQEKPPAHEEAPPAVEAQPSSPPMPSAYTVDEEETADETDGEDSADSATEEIKNEDEANLDLF